MGRLSEVSVSTWRVILVSELPRWKRDGWSAAIDEQRVVDRVMSCKSEFGVGFTFAQLSRNVGLRLIAKAPSVNHKSPSRHGAESHLRHISTRRPLINSLNSSHTPLGYLYQSQIPPSWDCLCFHRSRNGPRSTSVHDLFRQEQAPDAH
jgi:hypothetical protein